MAIDLKGTSLAISASEQKDKSLNEGFPRSELRTLAFSFNVWLLDVMRHHGKLHEGLGAIGSYLEDCKNIGDFSEGLAMASFISYHLADIFPSLSEDSRSKISILSSIGIICLAESPFTFAGFPDKSDIPAGVIGALAFPLILKLFKIFEDKEHLFLLNLKDFHF